MVFISAAAFIACLPRKGKTLRIVRVPFVAPIVSVLIIGGLALGLIEVAAYFTTIDNMTLSGKPL
jgi:hypothetical protein